MRRTILMAACLLAGCADEPTDEERAAQAQQDVALVEKANNVLPPIEEVVPEPISAADIERYDLLGPACNYAPGTSLGTRVVARESDAFLKVDGEVQRLAADIGSRELPQRTRSLYSGREYSLRLQVNGEPMPAAEGKQDFDGAVTLRDSHGRVVYEGAGLARCGS